MPIFKPPKTGGGSETPNTGTPSQGGINGGQLGDDPPPYRPAGEPDCVETSSCSNNNGKGDKEPPEIPDSGGSADSSSSSSSSYGSWPAYIGPRPAWNTTYSSPSTDSSSHSTSSGDPSLPIWAITLIIVASFMGVVFFVSLWMFCAKERQKLHERNKNPSYRRALRKALAAATGVFIPIWIIKKCRSKPREEDKDYAKIEAYLRYEDSRSASETAYVSPVKVQRTPSMVSSLSSHSGSQARYERLQPSPISESASLAPSTLQRPLGAQAQDHYTGNSLGKMTYTSTETDSGREMAMGGVLNRDKGEIGHDQVQT
ncbi:hypothetical protein F5X99DRAFT_403178 [Biscogniauxia marginata]|nr:hypothetical protein F5X99DRAFT_403178 [Biscogniauxia marginata]